MLTFFYIQVYATEVLGISEESGATLIIIINALGIPVRAPLGYLTDHYIGPLNCLIPCVALCGIMIFAWAAAAAMALFVGTKPSLTKDLDKIGTRVGMALTIMSFGPLTGSSVAGTLIARTGGEYLAAQMWAGAALIVAVFALVGARVIISGPRVWAKL
ncbi:monocarboxylate permease [Aspergillus eucalypticola CBS 122712]|uniref:Monocarboxylate permease n=1 Tax=Aspergillus eucalypticola (strain CBS 122712 / IBT 29274) TaxID=1448314 RepID=A0A317VAJ9_ASPEC|nr:monocarboxylate permease [Aspergillus eucalypticola CBS 122712]PWY71364.1 monocarboxylate permease [Aspergillus eucalypticola CBS 122712]